MSKLSASVVVALLVSGVVLLASSNLHAQIVRVPAPGSSALGVSCVYGFGESTKQKDVKPTSITVGDTEDCYALQTDLDGIAQGGTYQEMYDSAKYIIEHCASVANMPDHIWGDFPVATSGCQYVSNDPNRWPPYREWLKKVLYYNLDTLYYCEDVYSILSTFQYFNAQRGYDYNGALAVLEFLEDSNRCSSFFSQGFLAEYKSSRQAEYQAWKDTVKNPDLTPFSQDTANMPTLEDLDLGLLRGPQYAAVKNAFSPSSGTKLLYLKASENPFTDETSLLFGLTDAEYMRVDVYDVLGNTLYTDTHLYGEGSNSWVLPASSLPRGTMYVRLSAMSGEVKTIKLVKQE